MKKLIFLFLFMFVFAGNAIPLEWSNFKPEPVPITQYQMTNVLVGDDTDYISRMAMALTREKQFELVTVVYNPNWNCMELYWKIRR